MQKHTNTHIYIHTHDDTSADRLTETRIVITFSSLCIYRNGKIGVSYKYDVR